jgi:hypothetical protein
MGHKESLAHKEKMAVLYKEMAADLTGTEAALFVSSGSMGNLIPVYLMMAYAHITLYIPMAMMGIAFSLIPAVMWPSVAYVVPESKLGTAYGLMTMIQNIGLFGYNLLIGWANDASGASASNPGGYALGMWIFSARRAVRPLLRV